MRWLGRSLLGLEKARNGKLNRSHGYVADELRVGARGKGQLQFMPRRRERQGNTWNLVLDQTVQWRKSSRDDNRIVYGAADYRGRSQRP